MKSDMRDLTNDQLATVCAHTELDLGVRQLAGNIYANRMRESVPAELQQAATRYNNYPLNYGS